MKKEQPSLAYETAGNPSNPALLLVHGFLSCNAQWLTNVERLSAEYYLVMAELWGHGQSPTPEHADSYTVRAYAEQFEHIRKTLGISHWHVLGQSYGAGVIINYALLFPEVCRSVITTNSRSAFGRSPAVPNTGSASAHKEVFEPRNLPYHPIHARRFPEHVKAVMVPQADKVSARAVALGGRLGKDLHCVAALADLQPPLVLINGRFEKAFQQDLAALVASYPALDVLHLDGGHSVNIEAAEGFDAAVQQFILRLEKTHAK